MSENNSDKKLRVYVDTSVVGGRFDKPETLPFWEAVFNGEITIIVSDVMREELKKAPEHVRKFFESIPESQIDRIETTDESDALALAYIAAKVVGLASFEDCQHVALATLSGADVLVSCNMKHIVNAARIKGYNTENEKQGYRTIEIKKPEEVINS